MAKKPNTRVSWGLATVFPSDLRISDQSWTEPLDDKCRFRHEYKPLPFDEQHAVLGEPTYVKGTPDHRAMGRRTAHRERYVGWRSHFEAMFRASVLARILDYDAETKGAKKRSIGGWPMLIRPDGNYELYDWSSAQRFFWEEQEYCPDLQTVAGAQVMLYTIDEMYWKSTSRNRALCPTSTGWKR